MPPPLSLLLESDWGSVGASVGISVGFFVGNFVGRAVGVEVVGSVVVGLAVGALVGKLVVVLWVGAPVISTHVCPTVVQSPSEHRWVSAQPQR